MSPAWRVGLSWAGRIGLSAVFAYAAVSKLAAPAVFARDIANYHVLPDAASAWAALFLPALELAVAAGLLLGSHARGAAALGAALLLGFALAMAQAKLRGIDLACGCFGGEARVSWSKVGLDLGLAGLAVWLVLSTRVPAAAARVAPGGNVG